MSYKIHVQQDHNTLKLFDASGLCILVCNEKRYQMNTIKTRSPLTFTVILRNCTFETSYVPLL